jgi:carboxyl-terminal processing protease
MKSIFKMVVVFSIGLSTTAFAHSDSKDWKEKPAEKFSEAEESFKITMQNLLEKYVDKSISKDELYRAATAGMLAALNPGEENWNELLSPEEVKQLHEEMSGKVTGIGIELKFDEATGYGLVKKLVPGSAAEKAGIKAEDQILSVDGKKFKGKKFIDMVFAVRGEVGKKVNLKILRDDRIVSFDIKREALAWTPVEFEPITESVALLSIRFFNQETPKTVEQKINEINKSKFKKLIVDVRDNGGGGFEQAVKVTELFVPRSALITSTRSRNGDVEQFKSTKGLLDPEIQVIVLTNNKTYSGAELFTAALKESRKVRVVGESTFGKWTAQTVETLPNKFAIKYTVKEFQSPNGQSYQGKGFKPDLEVSLPAGVGTADLRLKNDLKKRLALDTQLKAAIELFQSN